MSGIPGFVKRTIDVVVSAVALLALTPVLAVVALTIWLKEGRPIFYRQVRVGLRGRRFTIIKFRTMYPEAERDLGPVWSVPNDPRCTKIGYYLRRVGFDELPQLWNVLRGEMSLVGPRPERPEFTCQFSEEYPDYDRRHAVRVGLTGYAQIHGWRGYTDLEQRLKHDLYYIDRWSVWLDIYILALTALRGWTEATSIGINTRDDRSL